MTDPEKVRRLQAALDFIEDAERLSTVADEVAEWDMDEIARLGKEDPLPIERARPFYARILKTIHPERSDEDIAAEVEEILAKGPERPES